MSPDMAVAGLHMTSIPLLVKGQVNEIQPLYGFAKVQSSCLCVAGASE